MSAVRVVFNWLMPLTVLIWANWEVICPLSMGFMGFWFCNWVISRVMKLFCMAAALVLVTLPKAWLEEVELEFPRELLDWFSWAINALVGLTVVMAGLLWTKSECFE
ncbi:membrane hypothetical protein [mine drainage metagenome]|uniref:Transmembrane protein n=1 Tax=mine drainage metagenome TaxID=410659 RepID=A0A3P3ZL63_9ZZZZ